MSYIYLPHIKMFNLRNPPENLEELVKESFSNFTKGTRAEFAYQDKLLYLDNIRKKYARRNAKSIRDLIAERVIYEIETSGEVPDKNDLLSFEFMETCYDEGFLPFYDPNDFTNTEMKTLSKIITIVMNYEEEQNDGN